MLTLFQGKSIAKEKADGQGLASASDVEELTQKIPDFLEKIKEIETHLIATTVPRLEGDLQNLERSYEDFTKGKNAMLEALNMAKNLITNEQFKSANREEYLVRVSDAIMQINCLPASYNATRSVINELKYSQETLPIITSTKDLLTDVEELLPRHETRELGMWYEAARKRTKLSRLYIGFFTILSLFIAFIFLATKLGLGQEETENDAWYTAIGQHITLRLALLGAFTGVLLFLGKQISNQKKIYEEYGHKETMMKSFRGFASKLSSMRKAIITNPELVNHTHASELLSNILRAESELATAAIEVVRKNPAEHLSAEPSRRKTGSES